MYRGSGQRRSGGRLPSSSNLYGYEEGRNLGVTGERRSLKAGTLGKALKKAGEAANAKTTGPAQFRSPEKASPTSGQQSPASYAGGSRDGNDDFSKTGPRSPTSHTPRTPRAQGQVWSPSPGSDGSTRIGGNEFSSMSSPTVRPNSTVRSTTPRTDNNDLTYTYSTSSPTIRGPTRSTTPRATRARTPRSTGRDLPVTPQHVHQGEGKLVRCADNNAFVDSRGGTSMRGAVIIKRTASQPSIHELKERALQCEKKDENVKFGGFTDRLIRWQDGSAMKEVFYNPDNSGKRTRGHEPGCKCPLCKPMDMALLPPAGQVVQVDVGNAGTPPYMLQVEGDGVMPTAPGSLKDPWLGKLTGICGAPRTNTLNMNIGRHFFKRRPDLAKDQMVSDDDAPTTARGSSAERTAPSDQWFRRSDSMKAVLRAESADPASEGQSMIRKEMGCKRIVPVPGALKRSEQPFQYDTKEEIHTPRRARKVVDGCNVTQGHFGTHFGESADSSVRDNVIYERRKKSGSYNGVHDDFTKKLIRHQNTDLLRFEGSPSIALSGSGCHVVPNPTRNRSEQTPGEDIVGKRSASAPPPICLEGLAGVPSSSAGRSTGLAQVNDVENQHGRMGTVIQHPTQEELAAARERRLQYDSSFADKCMQLQKCHGSHRSVSKDIKDVTHHMRSSSVAAALQWE